MTPLSILEKLRSLKSERGIRGFLSRIKPDNEFWLAAHYCLQPFGTWRVEFALSNPGSYGTGVQDGILTKIISGMESGNLSEREVLIALSETSKMCTEEQWIEWYKPVFNRSLVLPFGIDLFNEVCPQENKVDRWWVASPLILIEDGVKMPKEFFVEPYHGDSSSRTIWFCTPTGVRMFYCDTGAEFTSAYASDLMGIAKDMNGGIVFSGWLYDDQLILRDFITFDEFFSKKNLIPAKHRLDVLEMICAVLEDKGSSNINMVEILDATGISLQEVRDNMNLLFEQLFSGVVIRSTSGDFDSPSVVIQPSKKSIMTCIDISESEIVGKGTMDKKSFGAKVFYGLTFSEKEQYFKDRGSLVGSKFEILSCGIDPQGNALFPLFKKWRK